MTDKKTDDKPVGGNVYQRMHRAAALIEKRIPKANENTFQKFKYASHDDVVEFCRPALLEAGLVLTCDMPEITTRIETLSGKPTMVAEGVLAVNVVNIDDPADKYTVHVPGVAYDTSDKAVGKLISYAKKYALTACCGLLVATGVDSDTDDIKTPPPNDGEQERKDMMREIISAQKSLGWDNEAMGAFVKATIGKSTKAATLTDLHTLISAFAAQIEAHEQKEPTHA